MKVLLLSGGADSINIYYNHYFDKFVYIDYGQKHIEKELAIINDLSVDYEVIKINDLTIDSKGFYECRNLKFILAVMDKYKNVKSITFGTNADDKHPDNNREFFDMVEKIIKMSYKKDLVIYTPLKNKTKKEILDELNEDNTMEYFSDYNGIV